MGNRLEKYFDWMAVLIRKVSDAKQFSDKDFQSILCDKENKKYLNLRCRFRSWFVRMEHSRVSGG